MDEIQFHRAARPWGCFSPASVHSISVDEREWPTAEHYVLAQRFCAEDPRRDRIRVASLLDARREATAGGAAIRDDWVEVRDGVMYRALLAKFSQHHELRDTLLDTGNAVLVEHSHGNPYWGDGGDGSGQNMIGRTLMAVREELRRRDTPITEGAA